MSFSEGDLWLWADFGPDPGGNLILFFILTLSTVGRCVAHHQRCCKACDFSEVRAPSAGHIGPEGPHIRFPGSLWILGFGVLEAKSFVRTPKIDPPAALEGASSCGRDRRCRCLGSSGPERAPSP